MNPPATAYAARIAALHRELGLPADYAIRRRLALQPEADEAALLTIATPPDSPPVRLTPPAAAAWTRLRQSAQADGVALEPLSGFRSVNRQVEIIRRKRDAGQPLAAILASVAAPGYSEHHTGHALDLGTPGEPELEEGFALTSAYRWLRDHARDHGFHLSYPRDNPHGIVFEPWHWCWRQA
ncbi:MAG TPA: D-alanyl-D-alanine carboxypeptidase family protein [Opitutaceae bacterium]|nr:D-alanyl-D-alanine carboxypeptidase family protein [Opitutaceae bacterium]HRJ46423.1 D-alanyl-D-alanine carboxypeptidase family protein [Opitutaceae bacterium]